MWEYGFADAHQMLRATDISSMAESQLQGLPTNNLAAERNLAVFDKRAAKRNLQVYQFETIYVYTNQINLKWKVNPS